MKSTYVVTSGEYSDYRIHFVVESRELAEACIKKLNAGDSWTKDYRIEAIPVVESIKDTAFKTQYWVVIDSSGAEVNSGTNRYPLWGINNEVEVYGEGRIRAESTRSAAAALKAARDRLARYKAEQAGVATP